MTKLLFFLVVLMSFSSYSNAQTEIEKLSELIDYLSKYPNSKVGFLTQSNYESIKKVLPKTISPVIIENKNYLINSVINGTIVAGLTSSLPDKKFHDNLHIFSSNVVSLHSILMSPDHSHEYPHGNRDEALTTFDLAKAINAAVTQLQYDGTDIELAKRFGPKELVQSYTCKSDNSSNFKLPNRKDAKGILRTILDENRIKVLADGPYNWGNNDGNYLVDPPIGFYPEYLRKLIEAFGKLSGPDGVLYGDINIERVWSNSTFFPWYWLFDGTAHITEPYFLLDSIYEGSNKPCNTDDECFFTEFTETKPDSRENCSSIDKICHYFDRPRLTMLRASCTTLGSDSVFSTKRYTYDNKNEENKSDNDELSLLAYILIISLAVLSCLLLVSTIVLFVKLKQRPKFNR